MRVLLGRKSTRYFSTEGISLKDLSELLTLSCGLFDSEQETDAHCTIKRTYPSAGGRYPIEVYPVVLRSNDLVKGIYHYNVADNTLELIKAGDYTAQTKDFYSNQSLELDIDFPCLILCTMVFDRTMEKYCEKGYRFILLDAGHMGQNLYLVAEYLGLGIVGLGAGTHSDDYIDELLGLHHHEENFFYGFAVGYPMK